jgi:6-phosphogluconolactonase
MIINRRINSVDIKICDSTQSLVELMSRIMTEELDKGLCIVPGGRTPVKIFSHLSSRKCISSKSKLLLSDDRLVSIKSDKSNYKMLLDNLKISFENSLPLSYYDKLLEVGELGLEQEISQILEENDLNCAFLGVGSDGHTASLFPNKSLFESTQSAFKVMNNNDDFPRYTLSFKTIMKFKKIVFVISGIEKNFVLKELFSRENNFDNYPFQKLVMEHPNVLIVCDNAAGKDIG